MFAIIISEKGGAERRETFDKGEVNVGRIPGNDVVLPKGNVSKHHARLLFREGRFIVTDLKSTNGTYVNGRKIAQATIVRESDKIYVGDYVLRLEGGEGSMNPVAEVHEADQDDDSICTLAKDPPARTPSVPNLPGAEVGAPKLGVPDERTAPKPAREPISAKPSERTSVGAPPVHLPPRPLPTPRGAMPPLPIPRAASNPMHAPAKVPSSPAFEPLPPSSASPAAPPPPLPEPERAVLRSPLSELPPEAEPDREAEAARPTGFPLHEDARRMAFATLAHRVAEAVGAESLHSPISSELSSSIERAAQDKAHALRLEGGLPEGVEVDAIARDVHRELVGLGALTSLFEQEDLEQIYVSRFDSVATVRTGGRVVDEPLVFSSEAAFGRVIGRLIDSSGEPRKPDECIVERQLQAMRASLVAIVPPGSSRHALSIRRSRTHGASLDTLCQTGALSKHAAQFLDACVSGRASVLVVGTLPLGVLGALASAGAKRARVVVLQGSDEIAVEGSHAVALEPSVKSLQAAAKMSAERVIVPNFSGEIVDSVLGSISGGAAGVLAGVVAPTLRQGLGRLVAELSRLRPGISLETARESIAESFDLGIEVATSPDGQVRITRIAELTGTDAKAIVAKDVFAIGSDLDGALQATGTTPRLVGELSARGIKVDAALFRRGAR